MTLKSLQHPNVLPLLGATITETRFAMISEWMANGSINDFVKAHPGVDRPRIVGFAKGYVVIALLICAQPSSWKVLLEG